MKRNRFEKKANTANVYIENKRAILLWFIQNEMFMLLLNSRTLSEINDKNIVYSPETKDIRYYREHLCVIDYLVNSENGYGFSGNFQVY